MANENKIAKKLKSAPTHDDQRDIGLELFVARIFSIAGCQVTYEPDTKGPDFLIGLGNESFYCETKRIRENLPPLQGQWRFVDMNSDESKKLAYTICEKFRQLKTGQPNFIYVRSNRFKVEKTDLEKAWMYLLKQAQGGNSEFFRAEGYDDEKEFLERAGYCNGIILHHFWVNSDESSKPYSVFANQHPRVQTSNIALGIIHKAIAIPFKFTDAGSGT